MEGWIDPRGDLAPWASGVSQVTIGASSASARATLSPLHGTVRRALRQREPAVSASPCLIEQESIAAERLHGIDRSGAASRDDARKHRSPGEGRT
jgi:hypothetical protein